MLELAVWRSVSLDSVRLVPVPGMCPVDVRDHVVLLVLVRPVVELSVELAAVQILVEVPHLAWGPHVLVLGVIHVAEGVKRFSCGRSSLDLPSVE